MRKEILPLFTLLVLTPACSPGGFDADGAVDIAIDVETELKDDIRIVSADGVRPGSVNAVETVVVLKNESGVEKRLRLEGSWHGAGGGFFGGTSSVRVLAPGQIETFSAGTQSKRVTRFRLVVSGTDLTQDELLTASLADATPKAEGYGITYTETPSADAIPPWSARGTANGAPFAAKTVMFTPNASKWRLEISDRAFDPLKGPALARQSHKDLQTIYIDLPHKPEAGEIYKREMAYGGGYFQIKTSPSAQDTTSWNTEIAWIIEITEWDLKRWSEDGGTFQQGGTASGRLYIAFKGSEWGIANSWVSGRFERAPIVYYGKPRHE